MLTLECQNKMFSMISQGLMSHFSFRQLFQFIREHTRKQQVRISITLRVNARRCRLPEYLIAFKHRCVRSNCSCLTNIVSVRHKGGRVFRVTSASIFNDFECQKCKFVELPQAPFQKPFESCKTPISMPFIAFQVIETVLRCLFLSERKTIRIFI